MNRFGFGAFALALFSASLQAQDFVIPPGFGTVRDEEKPQLNASEEADGKARNISGAHITAENENESAVLSKNGGSIAVSGSEIKKTGNTTNDGQSNFYGLNAAVVAETGSSVSLTGVQIESDADGANAVFATGSGAKITAKNVKIITKQNSSRGLDATYGGTVSAENVEISTAGAHSAAFATDRGEGIISVSGGSAKTAGEGSPVIYSTGNISVKNITGTATGAEIAVIEGKNSINIESSNLSGAGPNGIMLYQSFSGDAEIGESVLSVKNSTLKSRSAGAFFYITNTKSKIDISNTNLEFSSPVLLRASGNNSERGWGRRGKNGGTVDFSAQNQVLSGNIECDEISAVNLAFGDGVRFTGAINAKNAGAVTLSLSKNALVTLSADSYVDSISDADGKFKNIQSNGFNLYYNKNAAANKKLKGKSYKLQGGGKLIGIAIERKQITIDETERAPMREHASGEMPALIQLTGTVKISGNTVLFECDDGREFTLETAPAPRENHNGNPPQQPAGNAPKMGGAHPQGNPPQENPPSKDGMQKAISRAELLLLNGQTVEIAGFELKDKNGVFAVFSAEKK